MNNSVFGKTMESARKYRDIELVTTEKRRNVLVSEPNYHSTKFFIENLLAIEMRLTQIFMNKLIYWGISILELSKIVMSEFRYDYAKPKYGQKSKLCCMNTDSFIVFIKMDDIYKYMAIDVETRFDTWNYELDSLLPKVKNKRVFGLMKDKLHGKIMKELFGLRAQICSYLMHDNIQDKKEKDTKSVSSKENLTLSIIKTD